MDLSSFEVKTNLNNNSFLSVKSYIHLLEFASWINKITGNSHYYPALYLNKTISII